MPLLLSDLLPVLHYYRFSELLILHDPLQSSNFFGFLGDIIAGFPLFYLCVLGLLDSCFIFALSFLCNLSVR